MSAPPPTASHLFYQPPYWCHSCDMSIALPPSPTPTALLCPHCHLDTLDHMDVVDHSRTLTPSDDNFLLNSPHLHRLIHYLTTTTTVAAGTNTSSSPAPRSSIETLEALTITQDHDPTMLCPVCKDPFLLNSVAKTMPCKHTYHPDCIVPWLEINNSCPVCRYKLPVGEGKVVVEEDGDEGYIGSMRLEDLVGDVDADLYDFGNTLRHIARRHRWNDEGTIGSGSEGNLFSPTQIGYEERGGRVLERDNSVETVSSWPWWSEERGENRGGIDDSGMNGRI